MRLDTVTAYVFATLLMLLNGAVLGAVHRDLPETLRPSAFRWRLGTLLMAGGCLLLGVQQLLPAALVLPLGNGLVMMGITLYWLALRRFDGRDEPALAWGPMVLGTVATWWFAVVTPSLVARVVLVSCVWVVLLVAATFALWRVEQEVVAAARRMLSVVFAGLALVMVARAIWFVTHAGDEQTIVDNGSWVNLVTPMLAAVLPIIGTTGFLMLCSERLRRELERAASTDALTGLANRRTLMERGERWVPQARAGERALALAMVDVDHFKSVNDRHGHAVGDLALKHVATRLRTSSRPGDLPARQGGEEFVVLFDAPTAEAAMLVGERLRQAIEAEACETGAGPLKLTASIGVATLVHGDLRLDDLLRRADDALYRAKANGRNRVELAGS